MFELLWVWAETNDGFYSMNQDYSPDFWDVKIKGVPSGKLLHNYGKIHHFSMGKSTISIYFYGHCQ